MKFASRTTASGILFTLLLLVCGCASIVSGRRMEVAISSVPSNAHVSIYNKRGEHVASGMTPMATELKRGNGLMGPAKYTATIQKPGYQSAQVPLRRSVNPWVLGNAIVGGIPGLVIDPITGAAWNPAPKEVNLHLEPLSPEDGLVQPAGYETDVADNGAN
jgi:hypothetical protein